MRPNLGEKQVKLLRKIQEFGVNKYKSQSEIIERALEVLWSQEKDLAYSELNEKRVAYNIAHPEEKSALLPLLAK